MSIKREKSRFSNSRIYKHADEQSKVLYDKLINIKNPYKSFLDAFNNGNDYIIDTISQLEELVSLCNKILKRDILKYDCYYIVPTLIECIYKAYYSDEKLKYIPPTAIKRALAIIWSNVYDKPLVQIKSINNFENIITICGILENLETAKFLLDYFPDMSLKFTEKGMFAIEDINQRIQQLNKTFSERGESHLTLKHTIDIILFRINESLMAIENILCGEKPKNQLIFKGTFFEEISETYQSFWFGLWMRIKILLFCYEERNLISNDIEGVVIFNTFKLPAKEFKNHNQLEKEIKKLFWEREWHKKQINYWANNLIVDRPLLRIEKNSDLYATSIFIILDSITWYIEASIFNIPNSSKELIPELVAEKFFSRPFEEKIISLLKRYGYISGEVTKNGYWFANNKKILLNDISGKKLSGQIDILAYNEKLKLVIVIECKNYTIPKSMSQLRNLLKKIGSADDEQIHSKLNIKNKWISNTTFFKKVPKENFLPIILLNRFFPRIEDTICSVITEEELIMFLKKHS